MAAVPYKSLSKVLHVPCEGERGDQSLLVGVGNVKR